LQKISIPWTFLLTNLLPMQTKESKIIEISEREVDIVALIKKMKVTVRNLKKVEKYQKFKEKELVLPSQE
jgi:hypothetical protein